MALLNSFYIIFSVNNGLLISILTPKKSHSVENFEFMRISYVLLNTL